MKSFIFGVFFLSNIFQVSALAGYHVEDGGGGILNAEGTVMSIGDANISFTQKAEAASDIPGLNVAVDWLSKASIPADFKYLILSNLLPNAGRIYHRSTVAEVTTDSDEYFVVTDKSKFTSVILANFYHIQNPVKQAGILLHEALTCIPFFAAPNVEKKLSNFVQTFQAFAESPDNATLMTAFYTQLSDFSQQNILLYASLKFDLQNNPALKANGGRLPLKSLFGEDFLQCVILNKGVPNTCMAFLQGNGSAPAPLCKDSTFCAPLFYYLQRHSTVPFRIFKNNENLQNLDPQDSRSLSTFIDHLYFTFQTLGYGEAMVLQIYEDEKTLGLLSILI